MAITQAVCSSFKTQLLQGMHNFTLLTGTNTVTSVNAATASGLGPNATATTVYNGTFTNAASNAYAGLRITMYNSTSAANNGTYLCVASTAIALTLANPNGVAQTSGTEPLVWTSGDIFAIALYTSSATLGASTTAYTSSNEQTTTGTYTTGGIGPGGTLVGSAMALVSTTPVLSGTTACCLFSSISWTTATISAYGALIYNASLGGQPSVVVLSFGSTQSSTAGTFTINFPAQTAGNAIIQLA
jgi:hypothetical protein